MWQERKQDNPNPASGTGAVPPPKPAVTPSPTAFIGRSILIKGRIESQQDLYIDGEVQGTVDVPSSRLTIGPNGRARAGAKAREIDVFGAVDGNVESSEKVCVRTGGSLVGDVKTAGIMIEDGAYFKGSIDIVRRPAIPIVELSSEAAPPEMLPEPAAV